MNGRHFENRRESLVKVADEIQRIAELGEREFDKRRWIANSLTVSCVLSGAIAVISTGLGSGGLALLRIAAGIFATRDSLLVSRLPNSARRRTLTRGPVPL